MSAYLRYKDGAFLIDLVLVPRAKQSRIVGEHGSRLKVAVAAPPVDGRANEELVRLLAARLGCARSGVELVHRHGSKQKTVAVRGLEASKEKELLEKLRADD